MPKAKLYRVTWEIDIYATSPTRAAEAALQIQRDTQSSALHFEVKAHGNHYATPKHVDLWREGCAMLEPTKGEYTDARPDTSGGEHLGFCRYCKEAVYSGDSWAKRFDLLTNLTVYDHLDCEDEFNVLNEE